jgi:hypothetical protein
MNFVGRKHEIAVILKSLRQNRNVILSGKYGVGRSSLVKHIARLNPETWQFLFADFSKKEIAQREAGISPFGTNISKPGRNLSDERFHRKPSNRLKMGALFFAACWRAK